MNCFCIHETRKCKIIYIVYYLFMTMFGGSILEQFNNRFVNQNSVFFVYIIIFFVVIILFFNDIIVDLKKMEIYQFDQLCFVGFFTLAAEVLAGIILANILKINNCNQDNIETLRISANPILLRFTIIFIAPIVEELFYRYCLIDLASKYRQCYNIFSIIMFAFMHVFEYIIATRNINQFFTMLPYIALGSGLTVLYNRTKNICFPIILHIFINAVAELA